MFKGVVPRGKYDAFIYFAVADRGCYLQSFQLLKKTQFFYATETIRLYVYVFT